MTDVFFGDSDVERVDLSYHESLQRIVKGDVDAVIWNVVDGKRTDHAGIRSDAAHRRSAIFTGHRSRSFDASR